MAEEQPNTELPAQEGQTGEAGDLIMDIPVSLSVELGRTQMKVREIMTLTPGTVVELQKEATQPVDLYVNGKLIGRGEVVVIDDDLGIKITEVIGK